MNLRHSKCSGHRVILGMLAAILLAILPVAVFASGQEEDAAAADEPLRVYMVPKFTGFVFFELAREGAEQACEDLGCELIYQGTTTADIEGQVQVLQNILPQRPDAVVLASLDQNAPVPVLRRMREQGTAVVTFDADVAPEGRDIFTNMASFEQQAIAMLESARFHNPEGGDVIWLAPHPTTANFISQKEAIDRLVESTDRYGIFNFIDTLFMEDDPELSYSVATSAMQAHPDLAGFITGSGMANPAVNRAIVDTSRVGEVYSTGFALPSTMEEYVDEGVIKQYALWPPYWFGYMATWQAVMLARGEIEAVEGATYDIPNVGERTVYDAGTGLSTDLNMMMLFREGNDTFETGILMRDVIDLDAIE